MPRVACILVANFPVVALIRADAALAGVPLVISESRAAHAEIRFVSESALKYGVRAGMTLAQACALTPALRAALRSPAAEDNAAAALINAAELVSPMVEAGEPGCVWLDLAGIERIHRSEETAAAELARRVRQVGMEGAIGIAANREIAWLAARCGGIRIIPAGKEREFLDWLPLDALALGVSDHGDDLAETLAHWGLKRLGDLARLDPALLGSRLGRRGVELARLARGESLRPLQPRRRAEVFSESVELEYGIETLEPLAFVMCAMLDRLMERIEPHGLVASDLLLTLGLADHRIDTRRVGLAAPTSDARAILTLINLSLEASPPAAAVATIRIEITTRAARPAQADLFLPPVPPPDRLETTIARLAALCGPENVGRLLPENSHRPEAVRLEVFQPPPAPSMSSDRHAKNVTQLAIRAIRPAREVEVMISRGMPEFVRGSNLGGRVVSLAGPWRRDGEWWRGDLGFARDYYQLALDDGCVYRVFRDLNSERWYADGVYD
jgi:protein ImuB